MNWVFQLNLPEGVSVDVIVSSVVDCNHVFVQQPTHPSFTSLEKLAYCMNLCYTQDNIVPQLPRPIEGKPLMLHTMCANHSDPITFGQYTSS